MRSDFNILVERFRHDGLGLTLRLAVGRVISRVVSHLEDRRRGVYTTREVDDGALGFDDPQNHAYVATDYKVLQRIMRQLDVGKDDVFVDIGSGKGRVVFLAAEQPFKRVIGVEFSSVLHRDAYRNLEKVRSRLKCNNVELVEADAAQWEIPVDATVFFFFNPFEGDVLKRVFDNIRRSLASSPRRIRIIYVRPDKFLERQINWREWLTCDEEFRHSDGKVAIYRNN